MVGNHRIAFVIQGLGIGGAEKFLIRLMNYFCTIGFKPTLFILNNDQELLNEINPKIIVITIIKKFKLDIFSFSKIKKYILEKNISTIFCVNSYAYFLTKIHFLFNDNIQFYISLHSTIPFSYKVYWQNLFYFRFLQKKDIIIYLCYNQKKYLEKKYFIKNKLSTVIYNGINIDYFNPNLYNADDKKRLKIELGINGDEPVIVMVARLQDEKCHTDSFNALQYLHDHFNVKAHFLIVGSGNPDYEVYLKKYSQNLSVYPFIHFVGSKKDVRIYYYISDMFTLTSKSETFSLSALEAMSFNLPCSLTDLGGANEMIIEGVTGKLSKPKDIQSIAESWNYILTNHLHNSEIRNHVLFQFSEDVMLKKYERLIS